jgi:hypothetical protein
MAKKPATKVISMGICSFCKGEFEGTKMTQHLKYCKQRAIEIAAEAQNATKAQKTKLFHIVVEGQYNPQYWMHLEMPVTDTMADLDGFLRDIWVECCDHLSAFRVGNTNYSFDEEDLYYFGDDEGGENNEEDEEEDDEEPQNLLADLPPFFLESIPPELLAELNKFESRGDLVDFLEKEVKVLMKSEPEKPDSVEDREAMFKRYLLGSTLRELLQDLQDRDMYVPLEEALKVGQKFFYEYDFGSTTHLALRVVSEREGVVQGKEDETTIEILARNVPPVILCKVCGKPAKMVASGYFNVEEDAYCSKKCARVSGAGTEMLLPVVNSPRVGVCGYTGQG